MTNFVEQAVREESDDILFISIQPKFSELIRNGRKTVELRKRAPKKDSKIAVVYESAPCKRATFLMRIKKVDVAPVETIWARYNEECAISKNYFDEYYRTSNQGAAFVIDGVIPLSRPISRETLTKHDLTPPQDYRYAPKKTIMSLTR